MKARVPLWLKVGWTLWLVVWAPLYWRQYGPANFLFFCDVGNILIGIALWLESPLIFSWAACGLLLFQSLYCIDLVGAALRGGHFLGATDYMFDPHLSLWIRLFSLFHVLTPPLLLWAVWRLGYDARGWKLQTLMMWIIIPVNHFWHPELDVNWARGLFFHEQHMVSGSIYLFAYLLAVPLCIYFPSHLFLGWLAKRWRAPHS